MTSSDRIPPNPDHKLTNLIKLSSKVSSSCRKLKFAQLTLSIKGFSDTGSTLKEQLIDLQQHWAEVLPEIDTYLQELQIKFNESSYPSQLEQAMQDVGLVFTGVFPDYEIIPFRLAIKPDKWIARLSMGKKSWQTDALDPKTLAKWVSRNYKSIVERSFNQERFCKELLSAYRYLSNSSYGVPVLIKEIHDLLTLKTESKQVYPESLFIYDLSRLLVQMEIKYDKYIFDFSPHKQAAKNYTLVRVNPNSIEKAIGMMTVRQTEG